MCNAILFLRSVTSLLYAACYACASFNILLQTLNYIESTLSAIIEWKSVSALHSCTAAATLMCCCIFQHVILGVQLLHSMSGFKYIRSFNFIESTVLVTLAWKLTSAVHGCINSLRGVQLFLPAIVTVHNSAKTISLVLQIWKLAACQRYWLLSNTSPAWVENGRDNHFHSWIMLYASQCDMRMTNTRPFI